MHQVLSTLKKMSTVVRGRHPLRDWLIGLVLAFGILAAGVPYAAYLFMQALNETYETNESFSPVLYDRDVVEKALARFENSVILPTTPAEEIEDVPEVAEEAAEQVE